MCLRRGTRRFPIHSEASEAIVVVNRQNQSMNTKYKDSSCGMERWCGGDVKKQMKVVEVKRTDPRGGTLLIMDSDLFVRWRSLCEVISWEV